MAVGIACSGCKRFPGVRAALRAIKSDSNSSAPSGPEPTPASTYVLPEIPRPALQLRAAGRPDREARALIAAKQLDRLASRKFDELEQEAAKMAADDSALPGGVPARKAFYDSFTCDQWKVSPNWGLYEGAFADWLAAYPASEAARLAAAKFYTAYAWKARGAGVANTVSGENWRLYNSRLETALGHLAEVKSPAMRTESYWTSLVLLARGLDTPREQLFTAIKEPLADPRNRRYVLAGTCIYLLPRWHGAPGEWQSWLAGQTKGDPDNKDYAYAATAALMYAGPADGAPFGPGGADWDRVKSGLEASAAQFPESRTLGSQLIFLALLAEDMDTVVEVVKRMDGQVEPEVFPRPLLTKVNEMLATRQP